MKKIYKLLIAIIFLTATNNSYAQLISATYGFAQTGPIPKGTVDAPIMKLKITVGAVPVVLDSLTWNTAGCTSYMIDVVSFSTKIFYNDTNSIFSPVAPYFNSNYPSPVFVFPLTLNQGNNYLWITYSVTNSAVPGHCLMANIDSLYANGSVGFNTVFMADTFSCLEIGIDQTSSTNDLSNTQSQINLYPNPTNGILKINIPSINNGTILFKISDCMGHLVFQKSMQYSKQIECDLSSIASGIYVAEIICDGKSYYSKLIKE